MKGIPMGFSEYVVSGFNSLTPDINGTFNSARSYSMNEWCNMQKAAVTGSGAAASAIPGAHLAGAAADIAFLMNRMAVCSFGIGAIYAANNGLGNYLEDEDFAVILGLWAGNAELKAAISGKAAADAVAHVQSKASLKFLAKHMAKSSGILIGRKLAGKTAAKIGGKFGAKMRWNIAAVFVPILGAAVGGGINLWFISEIAMRRMISIALRPPLGSTSDPNARN